jgi:hypothetical protein
MLAHHYVPIVQVRFESLVDTGAKSALFEKVDVSLLHVAGSHVSPTIEVFGFLLLTKAIVHGNVMKTSIFHQFLHILYRTSVVNILEQWGELAVWMEEVIVRVDQKDGCLWWAGHYSCQVTW